MSFLKWVGGKNQIIDSILERIPSCNNYYEPFLGGGSVLFAVINDARAKRHFVSDINKYLIITYEQIKNNYGMLITQLDDIQAEYNSSDVLQQEEYYYQKRTEFNEIKDSVNIADVDLHIAVLFLFLNKTGFRGLYRESKNGFNVPFGNYKNINFSNKLRNTSQLLQEVELHNFTWKSIIGLVKKGDFVYLDPPYAKIDDKSFTKYHNVDFTMQDTVELFDFCKKLDIAGIEFLMSNSFTDAIYALITEYNFSFEKILCRRRINSKKPQSTQDEVLIYNSNKKINKKNHKKR